MIRRQDERRLAVVVIRLSASQVCEVLWVEADVVAEAVVGDLAGAGLCEEPGVWDAEEFARGLRVDQRREACCLDAAVDRAYDRRGLHARWEAHSALGARQPSELQP
jgi:hypothetical protein